jgi:hypothetical protein
MERERLFLSSFILAAILLIIGSSFGQSPLFPLHCEGRRIKDSQGNIVRLRAINFNHYMEYPYQKDNPDDPVTPDAFHNRLQWSHDASDYPRVKKWGYNCVRLNISHLHITDEFAFDDLKNHVAWAKAAGVYLVISYFVPPGSVSANGYYSEKPFWEKIRNLDGTLKTNSDEYKAYQSAWGKVAAQFKLESHVIFELLNEPQLLANWSDFGTGDPVSAFLSLKPATLDETVYVNLVKSTVGTIRSVGAANIIIVDGLNYAQAQGTYLRFIQDLKSLPNLVYSFHYYHPRDFVWQGCNWDSSEARSFRNKTDRFSKQDLGWQAIDIQFNPQLDFTIPTQYPILTLVGNQQSGTYYFRKIEIFDDSWNLIFTENFQSKTLDHTVNSSSDRVGIINDTDPFRSWTTMSNRQWSSAQDSAFSLPTINGERVLAISRTDKKNENLAVSEEGAWASTYLYNYNLPKYHPLDLPIDRTYFLRVALKAVAATHQGFVGVGFINKDDGTLVWERKIMRYPDFSIPPDLTIIGRKLSYDADMVRADIANMQALSEKYNVPFFLGEFGVPQRNLWPEDSVAFFRLLTNACEEAGFGWSLYNYREPFDAKTGTYRTFGLYSGWEKTVSQMMPSLGTNINDSVYYYRRDFIKAIGFKSNTGIPILLLD